MIRVFIAFIIIFAVVSVILFTISIGRNRDWERDDIEQERAIRKIKKENEKDMK